MMGGYSLHLCERLAVSPTPRSLLNFTEIAKAWKRSTRARGGYWLGAFSLSGEEFGREELLWWYEHTIGRHVEEHTAGIVSWEGIIAEMLMIQDGVEYRRTLDREWFHNRVKILYRDQGAAGSTSWSEVTESSDEYGEVNYIDSVGEATAAAAVARRDMRLDAFAFPGSRMVGGLTFGGNADRRKENDLQVTVAGYVATMNWRYRETSIVATAANTAIADMVNDSEFVTEGIIDTNSLSVDVDCDPAPRLWDAIEDVMLLGDGTNQWVGGVYGGREFNYNAMASEVGYWVRGGRLVDRTGREVIPSLLRPDFIVRNTSAPVGITPTGGNVWDDPRNAWIAEVEFVAPDGLVLKPAGFRDVLVLSGGG